MGDLTPRQVARIHLAERAEAYVKHKKTGQQQHGSSLSRSSYDVEGSRAEWAQSFQ